MTGKQSAEFPNMAQRAVMQYLSVRLSLIIMIQRCYSEGPPMWTNENRARYDRSHLRYPSDLTDDEWQLVEPLIPQAGAAATNAQ